MATAWLSVIAATLTGALAWREWWIVGVTFIIPVLVGLQETRRFAALVALAYYGAASWPLMQAFECFGGEADVSRTAVLTWAFASLLLALPLVLAWTENRTSLAWRMPIALVVTILPPLGIIGWASPVVS